MTTNRRIMSVTAGFIVTLTMCSCNMNQSQSIDQKSKEIKIFRSTEICADTKENDCVASDEALSQLYDTPIQDLHSSDNIFITKDGKVAQIASQARIKTQYGLYAIFSAAKKNVTSEGLETCVACAPTLGIIIFKHPLGEGAWEVISKNNNVDKSGAWGSVFPFKSWGMDVMQNGKNSFLISYSWEAQGQGIETEGLNLVSVDPSINFPDASIIKHRGIILTRNSECGGSSNKTTKWNSKIDIIPSKTKPPYILIEKTEKLCSSDEILSKSKICYAVEANTGLYKKTSNDSECMHNK